MERLDTKSIRKQYGWTQKQFAEKIGVSIRTVQNWDQGRSFPDRRSRIAIESVTGCRIERLDMISGVNLDHMPIG